ncbi:MAG: septum site-determining protein MinC [Gammaproteobacteria bacterium]|nr:septum site-determining protein MinC [Gammaproteobacteria bacterium]
MERQTCFQFKASFAPCTVFEIIHHDLDQLGQQLTDAVKRAPDFFQGVPVVIDFAKLGSILSPDFVGLKKLLSDNGLVPVGVRHVNETQHEAAVSAGLPLLADGKSTIIEKSTKKTSKPSVSKLITTQVRSGMQVYARDADLIVVSSVSPGAELLADGHIHVYGPLRGRALAGVQGNTDARIFCQTLEAELVSIAGYYLTKEDIQRLSENHDMIQVYLDGEQVKIEPVLRSERV